MTGRIDLGLDAAERGEIRGAERFLRFVGQELSNLGWFSPLPERIRARCKVLAHDVERTAEFADGFASAKPQKPKKPKLRPKKKS